MDLLHRIWRRGQRQGLADDSGHHPPAEPGTPRLKQPRRGLLSLGWIASHLFVVAMVVLMVTLGFWQLRRHDERQAANAETAAALARDPIDLAGLLSAADLPPDYTAVSRRWPRRVTATGRYVKGAEVLIANRSFEGQAGSWLATPLRLDPAPANGASSLDGSVSSVDGTASSGGGSVSSVDGTASSMDGSATPAGAGSGVVMVVRGWVPRLYTAGIDQRPAGPPSGRVVVGGLAFASVAGGRIGVTGPGETPEISRPDLDRYREVTGLDAAPIWIRLRSQDPPLGELPIPVPAPVLSDGPHLSYAFQWFFFSAGAAAVYGLILRRFHRERPSRPGQADPVPADLGPG